MRKMISSLRGWPIGVWVAPGPGPYQPDRAQARIKSAKARGPNVHITVVDDHGEHSSTLMADNEAEARCAVQALSNALNSSLEDVANLEFEC